MVSVCVQSQDVKGQGSPLTGVHQLSQVSLTSHRVSEVKVHYSPVFTSCHDYVSVTSQVTIGQGSPLTSVHHQSHCGVSALSRRVDALQISISIIIISCGHHNSKEADQQSCVEFQFKDMQVLQDAFCFSEGRAVLGRLPVQTCYEVGTVCFP